MRMTLVVVAAVLLPVLASAQPAGGPGGQGGPGGSPPGGPTAVVPVGTVLSFAGSTAPDGYVLCDGSAVSRTTYPSLFAVVGTTFGSGDGTTTFNLPDLRGRVAVGRDDMGGVRALRVTGTSAVDATRVGATAGREAYPIEQWQMPRHTHSVSDPGHAHGGQIDLKRVGYGFGGNGPGIVTGFGPEYSGLSLTTYSVQTGLTIDEAGSGAPAPTLQPSIVLNSIIKY